MSLELLNLVFTRSESGIWDYSFSTYAKFSEKNSISCPARTYQGIRNVSFPENFAYVLNESSPCNLPII